MKYWCRMLLFVVWAAAIGAFFLTQANRDAHDAMGPGKKSTWAAASVWLQSAACALESGAWLVICVDGRLEPIAQHAVADDPGHAFLLALRAKATQREQSPLDIVQLNMAINWVALLLLCLMLLPVGSGVQAFVLVLLATPVYLSGHEPGPHSAAMGAATLASLLPLSLLLRSRDLISGWQFALSMVCGALALALAALLREPVGTMGLLMTWAALLCFVWRRRSTQVGWFAGLMVLVSLVSWKSSALLTAYRDLVFEVPATTHISSHGTAHNLYLGLGVIPNKFGIRWRDEYGEAVARQIKPDVIYGSHEYFSILRGLYVQRLVEDPQEAWRIYKTKVTWQISRSFPRYFIPLSTLALLLALDCIFLAVRGRSLYEAEQLQLQVCALSLGFVALFVLQGALAHPARRYSEPISAFVVLALATWLSRQFTMSRPQAAL